MITKESLELFNEMQDKKKANEKMNNFLFGKDAEWIAYLPEERFIRFATLLIDMWCTTHEQCNVEMLDNIYLATLDLLETLKKKGYEHNVKHK